MCGFRPTGRLHLGHYFSVIRPGQEECCDVLIANYHAPQESNLESNISLLQNFGVKSIVLQRDVFNPDLFFRLLSLSKIGDLGRMTQFKSCDDDLKTGHLMTYPVLMAHDVAGYSEVIVGLDQKQHLEYCKKLLKKYNFVYNGEYVMPNAKIVVGRIKDLRDPSKKMSKSSPEGCLFLDDSPENIRSKILKATMDDEGVKNIHFLYSEFVGKDFPESNQKLKENLIEALCSNFRR